MLRLLKCLRLPLYYTYTRRNTKGTACVIIVLWESLSDAVGIWEAYGAVNLVVAVERSRTAVDVMSSSDGK